MEMRRILLTGADGYIGSVLGEILVKNGYSVKGIDSFFFKNDTLGPYEPKFKIVKKDIRHLKPKDLEKIDAIIHLAGLSNDALSVLSPSLTEQINFKATISLAKMAKKVGVKKFLFSSSCSIYGISDDEIVNEQSKVNPLTPYAKSKIMSENALQDLADSDFFVGLLRNSTVYGYSPKYRNDLVVNNLTSCASVFSEIQIHSDGTPWRPFIDIRDLSHIFIAFLKTANEEVNGKIINIGFSENNLRVNDILPVIKTVYPGCRVVYTKKHGNDSRSYKVDFSLFKKLFPDISMRYSLKDSIKTLSQKLERHGFTHENFSSGKYERILSLRNLLKKELLSGRLFWSTN